MEHRDSISDFENENKIKQLEKSVRILQKKLKRSEADRKALEDAVIKNPQLLPTITITTELVNEQTVISIADNGLGISEKAQSQLFTPFFTTKDISKGTGLGLSISYQIIVELHAGILECHSQPGNGAEFVIIIPIKQAKC
jgi:two-component system, NtrC family, sensor kinase